MGSSLSRLIVGFFLVAVSGVASRAFGDLIVEQVLIRDRVTPSGSFAESQQYFVEFPPSPNAIAFSQTATIPPSYSTGTYDLSWSGDSTTIHVDIEQRLQGLVGDCTSSANIRFRPMVDSYISVSGYFNYNHPASELGYAVFGSTLREVGVSPAIFSVGDGDGTFGLGPPAGTIPAAASARLFAGRLYQITYLFSTDNYNPAPPGTQWFGNGEVHIAINPIPEPATLALIGFAIPFLIHRRPPRCSRCVSARNS